MWYEGFIGLILVLEFIGDRGENGKVLYGEKVFMGEGERLFGGVCNLKWVLLVMKLFWN